MIPKISNPEVTRQSQIDCLQSNIDLARTNPLRHDEIKGYEAAGNIQKLATTRITYS